MTKLLTVLPLLCALGAHAAGTDELWEMTTSMEMPGMKMPPTKTTFCMPKGGDYKPESPKESNCQMLDMKSVGNTTRWKMRCTGKQAMEGTGEMTRTADTMTQKTTMTMDKMTMTTVSNSKRIGTCDAAADKKKVEEMVASSMSKTCASQVDSTYRSGGYEAKMPEMWVRQQQCASSKAALCEKARGYVNNGGYAEYTTYANSKGWVAAECGINLEARRVDLCKRAVNEKQYAFVKDRCPIEAQAFADEYARNCQGFGRDYTADLARPNAKQCRALRPWAGKSTKGATGSAGPSAIGTVDARGERTTASPTRKPAPGTDRPANKSPAADADRQRGANKNTDPANTLMDSVRLLGDKLKF